LADGLKAAAWLLSASDVWAGLGSNAVIVRGEAMDGDIKPLAQFRFQTRIIEWRGPSPFFYAPIPTRYVDELRQLTKIVSYGWGVTPVEARIGDIGFETSLFPKDGGYLLPLKAVVRRQADITVGDLIEVELTIQPPKGV
jgi:hypothetical protein